MKLNAPTQLVFLISLVLMALYTAVAVFGINVPVIAEHIKWVPIIGYGVLAAGTILKGL